MERHESDRVKHFVKIMMEDRKDMKEVEESRREEKTRINRAKMRDIREEERKECVSTKTEYHV